MRNYFKLRGCAHTVFYYYLTDQSAFVLLQSEGVCVRLAVGVNGCVIPG